MKLITTPFLSWLCYGLVYVGVYDPWTFVGKIHLILRLPLSPTSSACCSSSLVPSLLGTVSWVVGCRSFVVVVVCCCLLCCFRRWVRMLLETLDINVSHSCAWTWIAIAIVCACGGSDLYVVLSGGLSLKNAS